MRSQKSSAVLLALITQLKKSGSWCGETHIQKSVFVFQELCDSLLTFEFVLYKHGPFSFDLRDKLTEMRADGLIELGFHPYPYGPSLVVTDEGKKFQSNYPKTIMSQKESLKFVATNLGKKKVDELERLATALYVTLREPGCEEDPEACAKKITELKPHIPLSNALEAKVIVDAMMSKA